jgi:hypothetical protein
MRFFSIIERATYRGAIVKGLPKELSNATRNSALFT